MSEQMAAKNTDRELWREREGDYYADSVHATVGGGIGINCGGFVIVKTPRQWHALHKSLQELFMLLENGELVRNTTLDFRDDFHERMFKFVAILKRAQEHYSQPSVPAQGANRESKAD